MVSWKYYKLKQYQYNQGRSCLTHKRLLTSRITAFASDYDLNRASVRKYVLENYPHTIYYMFYVTEYYHWFYRMVSHKYQLLYRHVYCSKKRWNNNCNYKTYFRFRQHRATVRPFCFSLSRVRATINNRKFYRHRIRIIVAIVIDAELWSRGSITN